MNWLVWRNLWIFFWLYHQWLIQETLRVKPPSTENFLQSLPLPLSYIHAYLYADFVKTSC